MKKVIIKLKVYKEGGADFKFSKQHVGNEKEMMERLIEFLKKAIQEIVDKETIEEALDL